MQTHTHTHAQKHIECRNTQKIFISPTTETWQRETGVPEDGGGRKERKRIAGGLHDHMILNNVHFLSLLLFTVSRITFFSYSIHTACPFAFVVVLYNFFSQLVTAFLNSLCVFESFNWLLKKTPSLPQEHTGIDSCMHKDINCFLSLHHQLTTLTA